MLNKLFVFFTSLVITSLSSYGTSKDTVAIRKIQDMVIYSDSLFYSAFPSIIKKKDGEMLLAFRRAPDRRVLGAKHNQHVDHNSYLVTVSSRDGKHWKTSPTLAYAHPFGGSQDPCLLQLRDGTLLCTSYGWTTVDKIRENTRTPFFQAGGFVFLGGYVLRSTDKGRNWQGPYYPPHIEEERHCSPFGERIPAYNRGALYETRDGRILWVVVAHDRIGKTSNYLLVSQDKGITWEYATVVAKDSKVSFNETSVYETPQGDIIAFMRTADYDDQICIARSTDGGKTFTWKPIGFKGHPCHALRLPDNRILLTYGYRHKPYGVRARILNAECTDYHTAPEFIIREDGSNGDLGYPWSVSLDKNRVLVVYYHNLDNGTRHIAGSILEIK